MVEWKIGCEKAKSQQFVDAFRHTFPTRTSAFSCWNTELNCRSTNYGTRIDYIFIDIKLYQAGALNHCDIKPEILGSDHCPVIADLDLNIVSSQKFPSYCTKNYPEFAGKQQKLSKFIQHNVHSNTSKGASTHDVHDIHSKEVSKRKSQCGAPDLNNPQTEKNFTKSKISKSNQKNITSYFIKSANDRSKITSEISKTTLENNTKSEYSRNDNCDKKWQNECKVREKINQREKCSREWKSLMRGKIKKNCVVPNCSGHKEPCVLRKVKKVGKNQGKAFFACARGVGRPDDPQAQCGFFEWQ